MFAGAERNSLVLAAQSGDAQALCRLLALCQADARRYAQRHCQSSDVDDAVQESLIVLARKVRGLKAAAAFSGWLMTVVKRECHRLARKMFRFEPLDDGVAESRMAQRSDDSLRIDLAAALESLPAHYLEVILLRDFEELTIAEMAQRLELEVPGVKSRLHRARELVREYLTEPGAGPQGRR